MNAVIDLMQNDEAKELLARNWNIVEQAMQKKFRVSKSKQFVIAPPGGPRGGLMFVKLNRDGSIGEHGRLSDKTGRHVATPDLFLFDNGNTQSIYLYDDNQVKDVLIRNDVNLVENHLQ